MNIIREERCRLSEKIFNDQTLLDTRYDILMNKDSSISPFDLLAYTGKTADASEMEYGDVYGGTETYTIRKDMSLSSENMYFTANFGSTTHYHSQNDCGTLYV